MQETVGVSRHPRISRVQLEVAWTLESASAVGSDRGCMRSCPAEGETEPVGKIPQRGRLEICLARLLLSSKFRLRAIGDPWRRVTEPRAEMPHQGCVEICLTAPASGFLGITLPSSNHFQSLAIPTDFSHSATSQEDVRYPCGACVSWPDQLLQSGHKELGRRNAKAIQGDWSSSAPSSYGLCHLYNTRSTAWRFFLVVDDYGLH